MDYFEWDPLTSHALHKCVAADVPGKIALPVAEHSRSSAGSLITSMLNLEESEWSLRCLRDKNLSLIFCDILISVGMLDSELCARVLASGILAVRKVISVSPDMMYSAFQLVMLRCHVFVIALHSAVVSTVPDFSASTLSVNKFVGFD